MAVSRFAGEARGLETRARDLIRRITLTDGFRAQGGLGVTYLPAHRVLVVQEMTGPFTAVFAVGADGMVTQDTWHQLCCYILSCTDPQWLDTHQGPAGSPTLEKGT